MAKGAHNLVPKHKGEGRPKGGDIHMSHPALEFDTSNPDEATHKTGIHKGGGGHHRGGRLGRIHAALTRARE